MRRNRSNFQAERTEINVSPLIDMVFILLIFFIVATSSLMRSESLRITKTQTQW